MFSSGISGHFNCTAGGVVFPGTGASASGSIHDFTVVQLGRPNLCRAGSVSRLMCKGIAVNNYYCSLQTFPREIFACCVKLSTPLNSSYQAANILAKNDLYNVLPYCPTGSWYYCTCISIRIIMEGGEPKRQNMWRDILCCCSPKMVF